MFTMEHIIYPITVQTIENGIESTLLQVFDLITNHILQPDTFEIDCKNHANLIGANMQLKFDHGSLPIPKSGEVVELKGSIPLLSTWEIPTQNFVLISDAIKAEKQLSEYLGKFNLIKTDDLSKENSVTNKEAFLFARGTIPPDMDMHYDELFPIVHWTCVTTFLDDIVDNPKVVLKTRPNRMEMVRAIDIVCSIIRGEDVSSAIIMENSIPVTKELCDIYSDIKNRMTNLADFEGEAEPVLDSMIEWLEAVAWECEGWSSADRTNETLVSYLARKECTVGWRTLIEVVALVNHTHLSKRIRNDPLFKYMWRLWGNLVSLTNDVLSVGKEVRCGEKDNYLLIASTKDGNIATHLQSVLDVKIPGLVKEIHHAEDQLTRKFPEDNFRKYIKLVNNAIDSALLWSSVSRRYSTGAKSVIVFIP